MAGGIRSRWKEWTDWVKRRFGKKPPSFPPDPYAYVMAPVKRGPRGRSGAAVADPEDESSGFLSSRR